MGPLYEFAEFMSEGPGVLWMLPWTIAGGVVVELVCLMVQAITARRLLGGDADVAVQVMFFGARLEFDQRRLTRRRVIAIAAAAPAAALVLVVLGGALLAAVPPGVVHDALWAITLAAGFGVVLALLPLAIESRGGLLWRTSARVVLEELELVHTATSRPDPPTSAPAGPGAPTRVVHASLRNRDGAALGVEPLRRTDADPAPDGGLARRAAALERNRWRSKPPPGPPPPLWFGREQDPPAR